jgi:hypothetical protein
MTPGLHAVTARFNGTEDPQYTSSERSADVLTVRWPTALSVGPSTGTLGSSTTLWAILTSGGAPLADKAVTFYIDYVPVGSATTDALGKASLVYPLPLELGGGYHHIGASYPGTAYYFPSERDAPDALYANKIATSISLGAATGTRGQTVTLRAILYSGGVGLPGKTLDFSVADVLCGSGTTDSTGTARVRYTIPAGMSLGNHNVKAVFNDYEIGDPTYKRSSREAPVLTVK